VAVPDGRRTALCFSARHDETRAEAPAAGRAARPRRLAPAHSGLPRFGPAHPFQPARHLQALSRARRMKALLWLTLLSSAASALAQEYPAREIRSICNFSAGSGADIVVRYYSDRLAKLAGKPVVVENKVGVQGNIATEYVAHSKADGYTIMI